MAGHPGHVAISREEMRRRMEELSQIPAFPIDTEGLDLSPLFQEVVEDTSLDLSAILTQSELFGLFGLSGARQPRR